jgi:NAD-dependent deacetylase sirtuin 2
MHDAHIFVLFQIQMNIIGKLAWYWVKPTDKALLDQMMGVKLAQSYDDTKVLESCDFAGVVDAISSGKCKNIIVMTGAGISVAAGIPDFRTPGSGLYDNLQKYHLPTPESIFQLDFLSTNPEPFFALAKELFPGQHKATTCHWFIRLLHEKGLLLRNYTQNIDTLEVAAGIPEDKIVFAHGSFSTSSCTCCSKRHSREWIQGKIFDDEIPRCLDCDGIVKPDIVFFGENLPIRFFTRMKLDFPDADMLIVMGTSLTVYPFAGLISKVSEECPRVLINRDSVGSTTPMMMLRNQTGFDFYGPHNYRDVSLLGDCQETCLHLIKELGWESDYEDLITSKEKKFV